MGIEPWALGTEKVCEEKEEAGLAHVRDPDRSRGQAVKHSRAL